MKKITILLGMLLLGTFMANAQDCDAAAPPYSLDFESATTPAIPECTSVTAITTGGQWDTAANPGNGFISNALQYAGTDTAADAWFFTKGIQLEAGTYYKLTYTYGNNSEVTTESFKSVIATSPDAASATTISDHTNVTGGLLTNFTSLPVSVPTSGVYYFGFNAYSAAGQGNLYIDAVAVVEWTCMLPENVAVTNVTNNSATISWDAPSDNTSYNFFYWFSTSPVVPGGGPALLPGVTTINITDLLPNTTYYAFASNQCGPLMGAWTEAITFTTAACAPATVPYLQDFEAATVPAIPECNQVVEIDGGNQWTTAANPGSGFTTNALTYPPSDEAADAWFFTQGVYITGGVFYNISYNFGNNSADTTENLKVILATSPNAASMVGNNPLADHTVTGSTLQSNSVDFFNVPESGIYYLGFNAHSAGEQGSLYVDNIAITQNTCGTPANVTVTDITNTTATLTWQIPGSGNTPISVYQYVVSATNTPPTEGFMYNPGFSTGLTELAPDTTYYIFTRTQCGPVFSEWIVTEFTTATAGVNDATFKGLTVYPNPVKHNLKIDNTTTIEKVTLYNITGQIVHSQTVGATNAEINLEQLAAGVYTLNIQANGTVKRVKVIKQ